MILNKNIIIGEHIIENFKYSEFIDEIINKPIIILTTFINIGNILRF